MWLIRSVGRRPTIQNKLQYISEPGTHFHYNHQTVPRLIEFSIFRSSQTPVMTINYQQAEFPSSIEELLQSGVGVLTFQKIYLTKGMVKDQKIF